MVVRQRRKKNKLRGQRTHGAGDTKNRRGAGSRGGRGRAGSHKHKFSKYYADFGIKRTLKAKPKQEALNLEEIQNNIEKWIANGVAVKENDLLVIDASKAGFAKVLGKGNVKEKIRIDNAEFSKKAAEKLGVSEAGFEEDEFEAEEVEEE